jgi:glycosyltransferase involved in cell wall biosynthesis
VKTRKKILFVCDSRGISGAELVILRVMNHLDKTKFIPFVFCHTKNKAFIDNLKKLKIEYITSSHFPDIDVIGKPGIRLSKIKEYLYSLIWLSLEIIPYIRSRNIDMIHVNLYPNCLYCLLPSLATGKPLIWHVHNIRKINKINFLIYLTAGLVCRRIVTVSEACKKNLRKAGIPSSKMITIYNGMDLIKFNPNKNGRKIKTELGILPEMKTIGLFGQPLPEKGHRYFIEAASEVVRQFSASRFLIVGYLYDSDYQKYLNRLIDDLGLKEQIVFTGWREDIPDVMASVDILVHARITPEPAALVLMEAMATAKPVIATATGGTPELVVDQVTGIVVPPKDPKALANSILALLKNPEKAIQMGNNGRRKVEENYTIERQMLSLEKTFWQIM